MRPSSSTASRVACTRPYLPYRAPASTSAWASYVPRWPASQARSPTLPSPGSLPARIPPRRPRSRAPRRGGKGRSAHSARRLRRRAQTRRDPVDLDERVRPPPASPALCRHAPSRQNPGRPHRPLSGARTLVDEGIFLSGSLPESATGLQAYHAAGADEVAVNLSAVGVTRGPVVATREPELLLTVLAPCAAHNAKSFAPSTTQRKFRKWCPVANAASEAQERLMDAIDDLADAEICAGVRQGPGDGESGMVEHRKCDVGHTGFVGSGLGSGRVRLHFWLTGSVPRSANGCRGSRSGPAVSSDATRSRRSRRPRSDPRSNAVRAAGARARPASRCGSVSAPRRTRGAYAHDDPLEPRTARWEVTTGSCQRGECGRGRSHWHWGWPQRSRVPPEADEFGDDSYLESPQRILDGTHRIGSTLTGVLSHHETFAPNIEPECRPRVPEVQIRPPTRACPADLSHDRLQMMVCGRTR